MESKSYSGKIDLLTLDVNKINKNPNNNIVENFYQLKSYLNGLREHNDTKKNEIKPELPKMDLFKFVEKVQIPSKTELTDRKILEKEKVSTFVNDTKTNVINQFEPKTIHTNIVLQPTSNTMLKPGEIPNIETNKPLYNIVDLNQKKHFTSNSMFKPGETNKDETNKCVINIIDDKIPIPQSVKQLHFQAVNSNNIVSDNNENNLTQPKGDNKIVKPIVSIEYTSSKPKLLSVANKYLEIRLKIKAISESLKFETDRIQVDINEIVNQLNTENDIQEKSDKVKFILSDIFRKKSHELYIFALNMICQKVMIKSEKYRTEDRKQFLILAKFLQRLNSSFPILEDYFFMIITFKCPYVIPVVYTKKDFPDLNQLKKRLGYGKEDELFTEWANNMECYSYLYFAFISQDSKRFALIRDYLECLLIETPEFPLAISFKTFLNVLGSKTKQSIPGGSDKIKKITEKFVKGLEEQKKKSINTDLTTRIGENIHFIKKYVKEIITGIPTDIYV